MWVDSSNSFFILVFGNTRHLPINGGNNQITVGPWLMIRFNENMAQEDQIERSTINMFIHFTSFLLLHLKGLMFTGFFNQVSHP